MSYRQHTIRQQPPPQQTQPQGGVVSTLQQMTGIPQPQHLGVTGPPQSQSHQQIPQQGPGQPTVPNPRLEDLFDMIRSEFENSRSEMYNKLKTNESDLRSVSRHELQQLRKSFFELEANHRVTKDNLEREIALLKQELNDREMQLMNYKTATAPPALVSASNNSAHPQSLHQPVLHQPAPPPAPPAPAPPAPAHHHHHQYLSQPQHPGHHSNELAAAPQVVPTKSRTSSYMQPQGYSYSGTNYQPQGPPLNSTSAPPPQQHAVVSRPTQHQQLPLLQLQNTPIPPPVKQDSDTPQKQQTPLVVGANNANFEMNTEKSHLPVAPVYKTSHFKEIPDFLKELDPDLVPPSIKKETPDYFVLFNPALINPKNSKFDVSLAHSFDHDSIVCSVKFSHDGKYLATGCNRQAKVFDANTGELVYTLINETGNDVNDDITTSSSRTSASATTAKPSDAAASSTESTVANADADSSMVKANPNNSEVPDLYVRALCFSSDGKYLATGSEDRIIRIWDLTTQTIVKYLKGHEQDIYSLEFFPDSSSSPTGSKRLASGSGDRTVKIWDIETAAPIADLPLDDGVTTVSIDPLGTYIAAGSLDRSIRIWNASNGQLCKKIDPESDANLNGHRDSVYSVAFTSNGREIVTGSLDNTVKLWDLKLDDHDEKSSPVCKGTYVGHYDFVLSVSPINDYIFSGSKDRGVIMWDKETTEAIFMLQGHKNSIISVHSSNASTSNHGWFATGSGDSKANIWKWVRN